MSQQPAPWSTGPATSGQGASPGPEPRPGFSNAHITPQWAHPPVHRPAAPPPPPQKQRPLLPLILIAAVVSTVGLLILAAIALSTQIGNARGDIRTVQDHDHIVSIELPISWDANIATPTDPDYLPQSMPTATSSSSTTE